MKVDILKLKSIMVLREVKQGDIAHVLGLSRSRVSDRFKNPQTFSIEEMNKLIKYLEIDNPSDVFFA